MHQWTGTLSVRWKEYPLFFVGKMNERASYSPESQLKRKSIRNHLALASFFWEMGNRIFSQILQFKRSLLIRNIAGRSTREHKNEFNYCIIVVWNKSLMEELCTCALSLWERVLFVLRKPCFLVISTRKRVVCSSRETVVWKRDWNKANCFCLLRDAEKMDPKRDSILKCFSIKTLLCAG